MGCAFFVYIYKIKRYNSEKFLINVESSYYVEVICTNP